MIILIVVVVLLIIVAGLLIKYLLSKKLILDKFSKNNVIVDGKKGSGKDILFQFVINHKKEKYFANIPYGNDYRHCELSDLSVSPNTYEQFINGDIKKVDKNLQMEGCDVYISDGGIYLPSQYDSLLHKKYPSFPIYYALSRHLYNQNIHVNVQSLDRLWKAIREQADTYIHCKRTIRFIPFILITFFISYDKKRSAQQEIEPFEPHKHGLLKERELTDNEKAKFKSLYGEVKKGFIINFKRKMYYDTRYFEKVVFNNPSANAQSHLHERLGLKKLLKIFKKKKKVDTSK